MAASNSGWHSHAASQPFNAGKGSVPNHAGSTAANWRTNGKTAMSVAQRLSPPS
jgi:hypothetical protein